MTTQQDGAGSRPLLWSALPGGGAQRLSSGLGRVRLVIFPDRRKFVSVWSEQEVGLPTYGLNRKLGLAVCSCVMKTS